MEHFLHFPSFPLTPKILIPSNPQISKTVQTSSFPNFQNPHSFPFPNFQNPHKLRTLTHRSQTKNPSSLFPNSEPIVIVPKLRTCANPSFPNLESKPSRIVLSRLQT